MLQHLCYNICATAFELQHFCYNICVSTGAWHPFPSYSSFPRATRDLDPCAVSPGGGSLVVVHVIRVPAEAAARVLARVASSIGLASTLLDAPPVGAGAGAEAILPPLVAFGLMQHEGKMSVVHGGIKKVAAFTEPIRNKEELLIVTGVGVEGVGRGAERVTSHYLSRQRIWWYETPI